MNSGLRLQRIAGGGRERRSFRRSQFFPIFTIEQSIVVVMLTCILCYTEKAVQNEAVNGAWIIDEELKELFECPLSRFYHASARRTRQEMLGGNAGTKGLHTHVSAHIPVHLHKLAISPPFRPFLLPAAAATTTTTTTHLESVGESATGGSHADWVLELMRREKSNILVGSSCNNDSKS